MVELEAPPIFFLLLNNFSVFTRLFNGMLKFNLSIGPWPNTTKNA